MTLTMKPSLRLSICSFQPPFFTEPSRIPLRSQNLSKLLFGLGAVIQHRRRMWEKSLRRSRIGRSCDHHDEGNTCLIDTLLLSCRVIGRTVETALLAHLAQSAASRSWALCGPSRPTRRAPVTTRAIC